MTDSIIALLAAVIVCIITVGSAAIMSEASCNAKAEIQELEWSWSLFQGCMVKQDGKWVDYDRLRYMTD